MTPETHISEGYETMRHMGKPLGATFIGIAIMVLLVGVNRSVLSSPFPKNSPILTPPGVPCLPE